ncbi:tripartite motif-containing protein 54-like [Littorina saxatilis]|uniref:Uncharacterized protein n=1 Tax=Littorina saxatilis TaxID=31220 RepID=A0AAN9AKB0_9CAEN
MASGGDEVSMDTCAVCLDTYHEPKFLPCHHTFCAKCIKDLANRQTGGPFPCPSCRKPTSLPAGGVAALQANFYLKKQSENSEEMCKIHRKRELEFYCVRCQEAICINCKMTKHEQHQTDDLHAAFQQKQKELLTEKTRLQEVEKDLRERLKTTRAEQQAVLDKKGEVEENIRDRHAVMVDAALKFRDEALDSLRSVSTDIEGDIDQILKQQENDLKELLKLKRQVEHVCNIGKASNVISVVQELKTGCGSEQVLAKLTSHGFKTVCRPVLHVKVTGDVMLLKTRDFMGTVTKMEMEVAAPEVRVVKRFPCGQEADIQVFSLRHVDRDPPVVWVSYERRGLKGDAVGKAFTEDGEYKQDDNVSGKISYKRFTKGICMRPTPQAGSLRTHCKSLSTRHFQLKNKLSGKAEVAIVTIISAAPLKEKTKTEFSINVGAHRAFDVDDTEQFFVVVEEPQLADVWRKVKLYRRPGADAISTYSPPAHLPCCQPSDVSFYRLGGQHVLLVTDEENDAIHVVDVSGGRLRFVRYLAPGCPWLIQPTAITVDASARLWLACRGGTILCMEPVDK